MQRMLVALLGVFGLLIAAGVHSGIRPVRADGGVCGDLVQDETGDARDEVTGAPAPIFPEGDLQSGQVLLSGGQLWVRFFPAAKLDIAEIADAGGGYVVYLDLDRDPATGYASEHLAKLGLGADVALFLVPKGQRLAPSVRSWDAATNAFEVSKASAATEPRSPIPNLSVDAAGIGVSEQPFNWLMFAYQGTVSDAVPDSGPKTCDPKAAAPTPSPTPTATPTATPAPTKTAPPTPTATPSASPTVVLPVETPTVGPTIETTPTPSPGVSLTPTAAPPTAAPVAPSESADDSGSSNTPLLVLLGLVTTVGGTAIGFVTGRKRPGGPPAEGMPAPPDGPGWRFVPPTVLPLRTLNRSEDDDRNEDPCELVVEVRPSGQATLSFAAPSGAIRPMESAVLAVRADIPTALVATTSHESKRTTASMPVAGWAEVAWEIVDGEGHFVPAGSTAWLADAESANPARVVTGNAVVVRGRRGKVLVRCVVTDGRSGDELHRRTITVDVDDGSNEPGRSEDQVSVAGDTVETASEACSIAFSPWRDGSPLGWRLKICERSGDAKRLIAAEGDHVVLDAASLFGQATDEDEIDIRAGHPGRPVTRTIRLADGVSYAWSADAGFEPAAEGAVGVFTAPLLHTDAAPSDPAPRTYTVTARRHDSGQQFADPDESMTIDVEVRPIIVEWLLVRRADGTVGSRALRVGEFVYDWERPGADAALRGVVQRSLFEAWLQAANASGLVSGLRLTRMPARERQALRWRMAALHAAQADALRTVNALQPPHVGDVVAGGLLAATAMAAGGAAMQPAADAVDEWLDGPAGQALGVRRIDY